MTHTVDMKPFFETVLDALLEEDLVEINRLIKAVPENVSASLFHDLHNTGYSEVAEALLDLWETAFEVNPQDYDSIKNYARYYITDDSAGSIEAADNLLDTAHCMQKMQENGLFDSLEQFIVDHDD